MLMPSIFDEIGILVTPLHSSNALANFGQLKPGIQLTASI
jgi:hypothetical protein